MVHAVDSFYKGFEDLVSKYSMKDKYRLGGVGRRERSSTHKQNCRAIEVNCGTNSKIILR